MKQANTSGIGAKAKQLGWMWSAVVVAGVVLGSALPGPQTMPAVAKGKSASDQSDKSGSAEASISAAVNVLESGKAEAASQQLSALISGGKITSAQMARALYYRGMAYRKVSKPAQAIADLTSALWIKNGLEAAQRNDALLQRAGAYREAGLADQAEADEKRAAAGDKGGSASPSGTKVASAEAAPSASSSQSGLGFGNFFGSLFGGGSSSASQPPAPAQTASVGDWSTSSSHATGSRRSDASGEAPAAAVSSWTTGSTVTANASAATVQKASVQRSSASSGKFVQIAAVRSRDQAQAVAAKVQRMASFKGHDAQIDETVMGNMGTLYRVRLGPFASAAEVNGACPSLRKAGLDCLPIDR